MSRDRFDDECPGCRPAMVDVKTGRLYADTSAEMQVVNRLWTETTPQERQAWHRVTCQNSRALVDLPRAKEFADRVEAALLSLSEEARR